MAAAVDSTEVLVIGAGLAGAATAWRLAQQGREVLLAERTAPANRGGSSHGSARIFRHAYPDPFYAGLTVRALAGWRELEAVAGETLLTTTGGLDFGAHRDLDGIEGALRGLGVAHARMTAAEASARWPHLAFDGAVVHHHAAGVLDAERAVLAMVAAAEAAGARVRTGWELASVDETPTGLLVTSTTGETIACATLVVTAGGWLPELLDRLPGDWSGMPALEVTQQQAFHFPFPAQPATPDAWPIFVCKDELSVYSLPGGRDAGGVGFKIAEHDGRNVTTASARDGVVQPEARERIVEFVRARFPTVDPTPYAEVTCLYTSTPDEDFVLDRRGRVVVASPCSGHGAKFAPLLGELIAELAVGGAAPDRFRIARPAPTVG